MYSLKTSADEKLGLSRAPNSQPAPHWLRQTEATIAGLSESTMVTKRRSMRKKELGVALMLALATVTCTSANSLSSAPTTESSVRRVSELRWEQLNPARGDQSPRAADLWGNRKSTGATGYLLRPVDGFRSPPHAHNVSYRGVVIRGLIHNDDPNADEMWMGPGSFWTQPKGGLHITAAKGQDTLAYIEIEEGPYLVLPPSKAFANNEKPVNLDASNVVWLAPPTSKNTRPKSETAFLWGHPQKNELNGRLIKLPSGFSGSLISRGLSLRAVVISGEPKYRGQNQTNGTFLAPGSLFSSDGTAKHQVSCPGDQACVIYVRVEGELEITPS